MHVIGAAQPYAIGVKPSDTTLSYNYCVVQSVSPSCCMYLLDDVSTLHFTVWDFNLFTPNEQIGGIVSLEGLHVGGFSGHISGTSIDLSVEVTRAPYGQEISHAYDDDMQHILAESAPTPFAEVPNSFQYCVAANHFLSAETMHLAMCAECQEDYAESAFDSQFSPTAEHSGIFSSASEFATVWQCVCDYGGYEMMSSVLGTCMVRSRSAGASSIVMEGAAATADAAIGASPSAASAGRASPLVALALLAAVAAPAVAVLALRKLRAAKPDEAPAPMM